MKNVLPTNTTIAMEYCGKRIYKTTSCDKTNYFYWYDNENNYFSDIDAAMNDINAKINSISFEHSRMIDCVNTSDAKFFYSLVLSTNEYTKYNSYVNSEHNIFVTCFVNKSFTEKILIREFM